MVKKGVAAKGKDEKGSSKDAWSLNLVQAQECISHRSNQYIDCLRADLIVQAFIIAADSVVEQHRPLPQLLLAHSNN